MDIKNFTAMNEQDIKDKIKIGVKSPSFEFTDKVMDEISLLQNEIALKNKRIIRILIFACFLLLILSVFVKLPNLEFFKYSIGFSPVIMPIICLIFVCFVLLQIYDLKNSIIKNMRYN